MRTLSQTVVYDTSGYSQVAPEAQNVPTGRATRYILILDHTHTIQNDPQYAVLYGADYIAGGAGDDVIFGQLGNDTIQGDSTIDELVFAYRDINGLLVLDPSVDNLSTDGDDYVEGNGGTDLIFGNLGQDDITGGNSNQFGLDTSEKRPDDTDIIFGGAATMISCSDPGMSIIGEHALDSDTITGDNAIIFRLVGTNGLDSGSYLTFNYDTYPGSFRIIPRAVELLDYNPGGLDYLPTAAQAALDLGAFDEIHGESGDDFIYGMKGSDILFGEGQDDDLIGGYGHDWISGGTGDDGVIGDDGRIYTSRNDNNPEPLYGIAGFANNELDEYIYTPGRIQQATINESGKLKKTVNLTPFKLGDPNDLDYAHNLFDPAYADDVIYGGWGNDALHGADGDDAICGAEALAMFYDAPVNEGNVLRFGEEKVGEFAAYNEYDPWRKVYVDENGVFTEEDGTELLLNFEASEGLLDTRFDPAGTLSDGDDVIFGDLGNDWLVGGTGKDHLYGGYGDDLLNADDDHSTNGDLNNIPDTDPTYEDIAYGGAGRDVLIANTGGDRLIDWAGEFNSYIVPYAPFGMATVSRTLQPQIKEYLYDLSESDGADTTRAADTGADPERNGEPEGELGLVKQKDFDWQDQTGAPDDPQPGNIPGGRRDVLRSATFNDGTFEGFFPDSGVWNVENGALQVSSESLDSDAASVFHVDEMLPSYFEIQATIAMDKPIAGWKANAYVIFDYYGLNDFKFAGINASINKIQLGHRTAEGWIVDIQTPAQIKHNNYYNILLAIHGTIVTVVVDSTDTFSYTFAPRIIDGWTYGLNSGMVGFGSDNSCGIFDNIIVQKLLPEHTFVSTEEFSGTAGDMAFVPVSGNWQTQGNAEDGFRYDGTPAVDTDTAISLIDLGLNQTFEVTSILEIETTLNTQTMGGILFDSYGPEEFKFAAISAESDQLIIGHHTVRVGYSVDATFDTGILSGVDYDLAISLKGTTINVSVREAGQENWQAMLGYIFNAVVLDGGFGLLSKENSSSFDKITVKTDDPAFGGAVLSAQCDIATTVEETPVTVSALANDFLGSGVTTITEVSNPRNGTLVYDAQAGTIIYTPNGAFTGIDSFTYTITDSTGKTSSATVTIEVTPAGSALMASVAPVAAADAEALTEEALEPIIAEAKQRWIEASVLDHKTIKLLDDVIFRIADLNGLTLGLTMENTVLIDINAAGHGWFVDETPFDDTKFDLSSLNNDLLATNASDTFGRMDLLTVVMHELGHVLGLDDIDSKTNAHDLMSHTLNMGVRRVDLETAQQLDVASSSHIDLKVSIAKPLSQLIFNYHTPAVYINCQGYFKKKNPSFNESYHRYHTFSKLLGDAAKSGLISPKTGCIWSGSSINRPTFIL